MGGLSSPISGTENRYRYNGKELNTELGLNWYDYGFRWYDPSMARFVSVDPLAEDFFYLTTYQYAGNTPIQAIDLDGLEAYYVRGPNSKVSSERFAGILSLITGYQITISDNPSQIKLLGGNTIQGYEIIASNERFAGSDGIEGYGEALKNLLQTQDVQVGIQLSDLPGIFESYHERVLKPLNLDEKVFTREIDVPFDFLAHVISHELEETFSLTRNGLDPGSKITTHENYFIRDHPAGTRFDLGVVKQIMGVEFDEDVAEEQDGYLEYGHNYYPDFKNGTFVIKYSVDNDRFSDVQFRYYPDSDFQNGDESRIIIWPQRD